MGFWCRGIAGLQVDVIIQERGEGVSPLPF